VEDFRDAAVVQAGLGGDVASRETSFPRSLEALAAFGAGLVSLALRFLKRGLETPQVGSGLLLGSAHDCRSLRAGAAPSSFRRHKECESLSSDATRM
jgi:hypothetical protein